VVNAAHIDVIAVALGLPALLLVQRRPAWAGVLGALAVGTKISMVLYVLALLWAVRRDRPALLRLAVAGAVAGAVLFAPFLPEILQPIHQASGYVARQSVWHIIEPALAHEFGDTGVDTVIGMVSWILVAALAWRLRLALPHRSTAAPRTDEALRTATLLMTAWLLGGLYVLPWYDVAAWAPLLLLPASGVDLMVLTRTTVVAVCYAPGLVLRPSGWIGAITSALRSVVASAVSLVLVLVSLLRPERLQLPPPAERRTSASSR
jgi:hypothetical protein